MFSPPNLEGLPTEVLDMIFKHLPLNEKKTVRQVCKTFKNVVDGLVNYNVSLNNTNVDVVRRFAPCNDKIQRLVVEDFTKPLKTFSSTRSILANKDVSELILCGRTGFRETKTKTEAKPFHYPYLPNEDVMSRYCQYWVYVGTMTGVGSTERNLKYVMKTTGSTVSRLVLSSDIIADLGNNIVQNLSKYFANLNSFEFILVHHNLPRMRTRVNEAIGPLFSNRFSGSGLKKIGFEAKCPCNQITFLQWIHLYEFLIAHKETLEVLELKHFFHYDYYQHLNQGYDVLGLVERVKTVQVKRLCLAILRNTNIYSRSADHESPTTLEMVLLQSQAQLEVLKLDCGYIRGHANGIFDMLPSNPALKACSIHICDGEPEVSFVRLDFLKQSKGLKLLQIVCHQDYSVDSPWRLRGIRCLPDSLESLSLSTDLTIDDAKWILTHLPELKHIRYYGGVRRGDNEQKLPMTDIIMYNFSHFTICVSKKPSLRFYELGISNGLISSYCTTYQTHHPERGLKYRELTPFGNYTLPCHEQH